MWPALIAIFFIGLSAYFLTYRAIFIPLPRSTVKRILRLAKVGRKDVVYDLGCGDGRVVIEAAKKGAKVIGIENNPLLYWMCKRNVEKINLANRIKIIRGNFFKKDFHDATVVVAYLRRKLTTVCSQNWSESCVLAQKLFQQITHLNGKK